MPIVVGNIYGFLSLSVCVCVCGGSGGGGHDFYRGEAIKFYLLSKMFYDKNSFA